MNKQQKVEIVDALESYFKDRQQQAENDGEKFSQRELANKIGLSPSYITHFFNHEFGKKTEHGSVILTDTVFKKVSAFLGINETIWNTPNRTLIMSALIDAKKNHEQIIIDGEKGSQKTFIANHFVKNYAKNTFIVTCSSDMNPKQFMYAMGKAVGLDNSSLGGSRYDIRIRIAEKLLSLTDSLMIIDETENATNSVVGSFKDLYDYKGLYKNVGIAIIGANDFFETLQSKARRKNQHSYPQFISRFAANPVFLEAYDKKQAKKICRDNYGIDDQDSINWITSNAFDYRQLEKLINRYLSDQQLFKNDHAA